MCRVTHVLAEIRDDILDVSQSPNRQGHETFKRNLEKHAFSAMGLRVVAVLAVVVGVDGVVGALVPFLV